MASWKHLNLLSLRRIVVNCSTPDCRMCSNTLTENDCCDDISYHEFQIANLSGKKWKASKKHVNQSIPLSMSAGEPHLWRFEREKDESLWSFHVLSEAGEKLYLSYEENNNDITLDFKDGSSGGKKRLFVALVQKNGFLFRSQETKGRYIASAANDKLEMFATENPPENLLWLVKEDFKDVDSDSGVLVVEILHQSLKWISSNAVVNQPVLVRQSGKSELWNLTTNPKKWKCSPIGKSSLWATTHQDVILFKSIVTKVGADEYYPHPQSGSNQLQSVASSKWVGVSVDSYLDLCDQKLAVSWQFQIAFFSYKRRGKIFLFPHLRAHNIGQKVSQKMNSKNLVITV